jgi:PleD family two-component response regulator
MDRPTPAELALDGRPPLILIVEDQEWSALALESILAPAGYAVMRAYSGRQGIERALAARPDALLVDIGLPDLSGFDVCRTLAADPRIGPATPIILTTADAATRPRRMEALRAGAWEFIPLPPDAGELMAKLATWIRARREVDRARDAGLVDGATGLYNATGLLKRAGELAAEASRFQKPLACVVFTLEIGVEGDAPDTEYALLERIRDALRATLRTSDAIGHLGSGKFAVLAPATDETGARGLAERALKAFGRDSAINLLPVQMQAGYFGVGNARESALDAAELLSRAAAVPQVHGNRLANSPPAPAPLETN